MHQHCAWLLLAAPTSALQVSGGADTFMIITRAVASFIKLYLLLLFVRVLLSWFPTFQWWEQQPFAALRQVGGRAEAPCVWGGGGGGLFSMHGRVLQSGQLPQHTLETLVHQLHGLRCSLPAQCN